MKSGFMLNDKQKEYDYGQAYKIVSNDCHFISSKCKAEFHKNKKVISS